MSSTSQHPDAPGRVLVTDGEFKHTLGIVRRLAAAGHEVHLLAQSGRAPAAHSRAVRRWYPAPPSGTPAFEARLAELAGTLAPVSLVPVGSGAFASADRLRTRLPAGVALALPPAESLAIANDKPRTAALARSLGVRVPAERVVSSAGEAAAALRELGLPLVLKSGHEEGRKVLRYVRAESELGPAFEAVRAGARERVLAQEWIAGDGFGFCGLWWEGARRRAFMHRRVREWPPSGGTSACAESVPVAPALERAGATLLDALRWHGVAMVEFKGSLERGEFALIEINAKFWGSLDVALAAGVDFPADLVALMEGRALAPQPPVPAVRFAWPFGGDLWHGLFEPASLGAVLRDAVSPRVAHNWRASDPLPHLFEAIQWVRSTPGAWREQLELR
jgi:predicted ATP-grasp superfamily ATP-dependent carboligase